MATEKEVKDALNGLDPKAVSIDEQGRIIIKDEETKKKIQSLQTEDGSQAALGNYINCTC